MKVLVYENRKSGVWMWDASTPEKELAAHLALFKELEADKTPFLRNGDSDSDWRARIQRNVKGLGLAKASFAVALANPATSDVCCIDTHMYQLFTGIVPKSSIKPSVYLALENAIRELGKEFGLSTFATQWCLWDAQRGQSNPHSVLATI